MKRTLFFLLVAALAVIFSWPAPVPADESGNPKPAVKPETPPDGPRPPRQGDGPRFGDPARRDGGGPGGPGGPGSPGGPGDKEDPHRPRFGDWRTRWNSRGEQFTPEEAKQILAAVEAKDPKLAARVHERFADALKSPPKLTKEQIDKAIGVFEDRTPEVAQRIREGLKDNPDRISTMLGQQWPWLERAIELKEKDPKAYATENEEIRRGYKIRFLAGELRKALESKNTVDAAAKRKELHEKLLAQHQAERDSRKAEIDRLQKKIESLHKDLDADGQQLSDRIEKVIDSMVSGERRRFEGRGDFDPKKEKDKLPGPPPPPGSPAP